MQYTDKLNVWSGFALSLTFLYILSCSPHLAASLLAHKYFCLQIFGDENSVTHLWFESYHILNGPNRNIDSGREPETAKAEKPNGVVWEIIVCAANCACAWSVPIPKTENHICEFCQMHTGTTSPANIGNGTWHCGTKNMNFWLSMWHVNRRCCETVQTHLNRMRMLW